ncbi:MAG: LPS export ABC transporter periplasmic protein LptC [Pseudomonadota bacterium]
MTIRQTLIIATLALLALASHFVLRQPDQRAQPNAPKEAGYYVVDGTLRGLADNGDALFEISAQRAEQEPALSRVSLEGVDVTYADVQEVPWRLRANRGHISADWKFLELSGEVRIEGTDRDGAPLALYTDSLTVMVNERQAITRSDVRVVSTRGVITARGMTADLAAQWFELETDVRGRFVAAVDSGDLP